MHVSSSLTSLTLSLSATSPPSDVSLCSKVHWVILHPSSSLDRTSCWYSSTMVGAPSWLRLFSVSWPSSAVGGELC